MSLSFVFAATAQEILGSCIFLFAKHPYDIGDRVDITSEMFTVEHIALLYTVFKRVTNGKTVQIPNIVLNTLWVENITRSKAMREQVSVFCAFDTSFEDINLLKLEMQSFLRDSANNRDFHPDTDIEVVSIAEMNKLELRVEIRHKSNWSNETLRASRRSKFMCALVVALRKVPILGPGGGDAALGSQDKPSWSVSVPPAEAIEAYQQYKMNADASRLQPLNKPEDPADKGKSTSTDYLGGDYDESQAITNLTNRRPGVDTVRDDTWDARDDVSTIGRPSTDARPDLDEVRGLLRKASSHGRRKGGTTLSPYVSRQSQDYARPPPLPLAVNQPSRTGRLSAQYSSPPSMHRTTAPGSPNTVSTGQIEEYQYGNIVPPPRSNSRPRAPMTAEEREREQEEEGRSAYPVTGSSVNPYRSQSPPAMPPSQFKRE